MNPEEGAISGQPGVISRRQLLETAGSLMVLASLTVVAGCGGSGGRSPISGGQGKGGRVQLQIAWPERKAGISRFLPPYAESIHLLLYRVAAPEQRFSIIANRAANVATEQMVTFPDTVAVGDYVLQATAYSETQGKGVTLAKGSVPVTVAQNETATANLVLESRLAALKPIAPKAVIIGETETLLAQAQSVDGKTLLLPPATLSWRVASGAAFGALTPEGLFTATARGVAGLVVEEPGAKLSAALSVATVNRCREQVSGDAGNTGQGRGSGATGQAKWVYQSSVKLDSTIIVGMDGTVYMTTADDLDTMPGKLIALSGDTGAVRFQIEIPGPIFCKIATDAGTILLLYGVLNSVGKGVDLHIACLEASTGERIWDTYWDNGYNYSNFAPTSFHVNSTMKVSSGLVFVVADFNITALDASRGNIVWQRDSLNTEYFRPNYTYLSTAMSATGILYIVAHTGNPASFSEWGPQRLVAIESQTGKRRWYGLEQASSRLIVTTGSIYAGTTRYDAMTGSSQIGVKDAMKGAQASATGMDGTVYLVVQQQADIARLQAYDPAADLIKWTFAATGVASFITADVPVIDADNTVYFRAHGAQLFAIDGQTGIQKWIYQVNRNKSGVYLTNPVMGKNGWLYLVGSDFSNPGSVSYSVHAVG